MLPRDYLPREFPGFFSLSTSPLLNSRFYPRWNNFNDFFLRLRLIRKKSIVIEIRFEEIFFTLSPLRRNNYLGYVRDNTSLFKRLNETFYLSFYRNVVLEFYLKKKSILRNCRGTAAQFFS